MNSKSDYGFEEKGRLIDTGKKKDTGAKGNQKDNKICLIILGAFFHMKGGWHRSFSVPDIRNGQGLPQELHPR